MLIKVLFLVNVVLEYPLYGPLKSLNLILTSGQEPGIEQTVCICVYT